MMEKTKNKKQFYNTEIPEDWEIRRLEDIGSFTKGKGILKDQVVQNGYPCVRYGEIYTTYDFTIKDFKSYITEETTTESKLIKQGDILFAGSGETAEEIGKSIAYIGTKKAYAGGDVIILSPNIDVSSECLVYMLESKFSRKQRRVLGQGNSVVHIYSSDLAKLKIPLPPLPEQKAIASVLSTWDDAIHKTEQLIAQKELRKKWLMQELLTGKKRLDGFEEKWREVHIRDVAQEVSKRNKNDKQLTVLSCTKYDGLVPSLEYFGRKIFSDDVSTYKIVPKNHFAYATNHIEEGSLGYQNILDEALISPMYTVFKTDESINDDYFYKLPKSHPLVYQYQNRMEGSIDRRGGLRWDSFSIIKIKIPIFQEQTAITQVLQAADKEITLLRAKADNLREQKKGLMQMLLSGKKRLNYDSFDSCDGRDLGINHTNHLNHINHSQDKNNDGSK
jgi:type I restriction enzyme S subunit